MSDQGITNREAVEKALGEPFGLEYQEDVLKTRRNLLLAGAAAVLVYAGNLQFGGVPPENPISPFFGLALKGMTHRTFLWCLLVALLYLLVHFMTGPIWGDELVDAPLHPRQSTLYSWWLGSARSFDALPELLQGTKKKIDEMVSAFEALRDRYNDAAAQNLNNAISSAAAVREAVFKLQGGFDEAKKVLSSDRIPVSLQRFDKAFGRAAVSRNLRWLLLEFGFPMLLGLVGAGLILISLFPSLKTVFG